MIRWSAETRSGSEASPTRCGVWPSYLPLGRRYRDDDSTGHDGPRRRLHHHLERPRPRLNPTDGLGQWHFKRPGTRSTGRLGRRLCPVGLLAQTAGVGPGRDRDNRTAASAQPTPGGPLRPHPGPDADRRLHQPGHAPGQSRSIRGDRVRLELAGQTATHSPGAGPTDRLISLGGDGDGRPDPPARAAGQAALPHPQPADTSLGHHTTLKTAGDGGEP